MNYAVTSWLLEVLRFVTQVARELEDCFLWERKTDWMTALVFFYITLHSCILPH